MQPVTKLADAIERLYEAFAAYPLRKFTDPCLHCHTVEDEAKLHLRPLRQQGAAELEPYVSDALLVWGDVADFKHFLPRIFELYFSLSEPAFQFIDPEMLFSKFKHGHWLDWPASERRAVRALLRAVWIDILDDPPAEGSYTDLQSWLCAIGQAEDDLRPYLDEWIEDQRLSAALALSSFLLCDAGRNPFWDAREEQYAQLQEWKSSTSVIEKLKRGLATSASTVEKNEFDAALGCSDKT